VSTGEERAGVQPGRGTPGRVQPARRPPGDGAAGGSDLHLKVGRPPVLRINGELVGDAAPALRPEDLKRCAEQLLSPRQREEFAERKEIDFAIGVQGLGRFRANIFHQRGTLAWRSAPSPSRSRRFALDLPPVLERDRASPAGWCW
jgi:twitching motility protein PilT